MIEIYDLTVPRNKKEKECISFYQCGIEHCRAGHFNGPRIRLHTSIHIVLEGEGCLVVNKKEYHIHEGQAFLIPANEEAYYCADSKNPWKYCWIDFFGSEKSKYSEIIFGKNNYVKTISSEQKIFNQIQDMLEKFYIGEETISEKYGPRIHLYALKTAPQLLRITALFCEVLALLLEENENTDNEPVDYIEKIKNYMDHEYLEINEITEIARKFHLHPNYFTDLFKEKYHISPKKYLLERKLEYAGCLLKQTDYPIYNIARLCGFASPSSFGKIFKKYKKMSPRNFRNSKQIKKS